jgi:hypothetical protein
VNLEVVQTRRRVRLACATWHVLQGVSVHTRKTLKFPLVVALVKEKRKQKTASEKVFEFYWKRVIFYYETSIYSSNNVCTPNEIAVAIVGTRLKRP